MDIIPILAIWGSIISTAALTWNIIRGLEDKKKLNVEANIGNILPGDPDQYYFYTIITNIRRRPVYISGWGVQFKQSREERERGALIPTSYLPKLLKDGEALTLKTEDLSIFSQEIKEVKVWDSTGKKWKISRKNLGLLLKNVQEVLQQDQTSN
jgi:hypothetical protein